MFGSSQWMYSSGAASFYDTEIDGSLRFDRGDNSYLRRTMSSGNQRTWTFSAWVKRCDLTNSGILFESRPPLADNDRTFIAFTSGQNITITDISGGGHVWRLDTLAVFRDPSAWYHIVVKFDTTQATSSNRVKLYVNGVLFDDYNSGVAGAGYPSQNYQADISAALPHTICDSATVYSANLSNYVAEVHFTDGTAYDADAFGEFKSGVWVPKEPSVTYGTNGFHLEFAGNANDSSGNGNNWTANNIAASDYMPDSPTNNFCTWNPLSCFTTLTQGNLNVTGSGNGGNTTFPFHTTGKTYVEIMDHTGAGGNSHLGIIRTGATQGNLGTDGGIYSIIYRGDGIILKSTGSGYSTTQSGLSGFSNQNIFGILMDYDAGTVQFYRNGSTLGSATSFDTSLEYTPFVFNSGGCRYILNTGQNGTFDGVTTSGGNSDSEGIGDFKYSVSSGAKSLCTANLTVAEAVDPAEDNSPQDYFNTVLYTGTDGTPGSVSGVGFQPDIIWVKSRGSSGNGTIANAVRGTARSLFTNTTNAENTSSTGLTSFDSDGFSYGTSGDWSAGTHVAWNWKANGSGVSNTDGSITSTVSANTDAGCSVVTYSGGGGAQTVGHGLDVAPIIVFYKSLATSDWNVYSFFIGADQRMQLNKTNGANAASGFNNTHPNSSVLSVNSNTGAVLNNTGNIAYCFHSVDGYSSFGKYTGNGSSDGPFVYTGMRPAYVLIKRTDGSNAWIIFDAVRNTYNLVDKELYPNTNEAEDIVGRLDFTSNGFKIRQTGLVVNASGGNYIYMAFAENPFKYANAR